MIYVTSKELREKILHNFRQFLIEKARKDPNNDSIKDCLRHLKK